MKEAIISDLDGYRQDVTLVANNVTGVFPIKEQPENTGESSELYMTTGYIIASNVPQGLYKLKFDINAYHEASEQYEVNLLKWHKRNSGAVSTFESENEFIKPTSPDPSDFWKEGYSPSELSALFNERDSSKNDGTYQTPVQTEKRSTQTKIANLFRKIMT